MNSGHFRDFCSPAASVLPDLVLCEIWHPEVEVSREDCIDPAKIETWIKIAKYARIAFESIQEVWIELIHGSADNGLRYTRVKHLRQPVEILGLRLRGPNVPRLLAVAILVHGSPCGIWRLEAIPPRPLRRDALDLLHGVHGQPRHCPRGEKSLAEIVQDFAAVVEEHVRPATVVRHGALA